MGLNSHYTFATNQNCDNLDSQKYIFNDLTVLETLFPVKFGFRFFNQNQKKKTGDNKKNKVRKFIIKSIMVWKRKILIKFL